MRTVHLAASAALLFFATSIAAQDCPAVGLVAVETSSWGDEISWSLADEAGTVVASGSNYSSFETSALDVCLGTGCHILTLVDSFGDGWNGATWSLITPEGTVLGPYTLDTGSLGTFIVPASGLCEGSTAGCTDPDAVNFDAGATVDDGSCITSCEGGAPLSFYLCTFSNGDEVALDIVHESGDTVYSGSGYGNVAVIYQDLCLESGCYTATLSNTAGNTGWYNGYVSLSGFGVWVDHLTLPDDASTAAFSFSIDGSCLSVAGCTDSAAPNFNPDADWNDGSCLPPCDCDDAEAIPVCAYDWTTGDYVTMSSACEAACNGYYVSWIGDCSEPPVPGCMDATALNYNPEATAEEPCVYAPTCTDGQIEVSIALSTAESSVEPGYFFVNSVALNVYPEIAMYALNETTYGVGCLAPGCYNFFMYENWTGGGITATATAAGVSTEFTLAAGEYSGAFGWAVGTDEECTYEVGGCMDPEAENYSPLATFDDGSCAYPVTCDAGIYGTVYVCTFSNGSAVGLNITADDGTVLYDQQGFSDMAVVYVDVCLDPEACYTVTMTNNEGGYGWNGGYYWVDAEGYQIANGELFYAATEEVETFGWWGACEGNVLGCTDPEANNYDPSATVDDGSCNYVSPCPLANEVNYMVIALADAWVEISDANGEILVESAVQNGAWTGAVCLVDGCYDFRMESMNGGSLAGSFATLSMQDGTMLSMVADDVAVMDEPFGIGADCGNGGFGGYGGSPWEFDETIAFTPYPNPTENVVNIAGGGWDQHFPIDVTVHDLAGKVVHRMQVPATEQPRIAASNWPAGMYFIHVQQGERTGTAPFMKVN